MSHRNMLNQGITELQCIDKYVRIDKNFFLNYQEQLGINIVFLII